MYMNHSKILLDSLLKKFAQVGKQNLMFNLNNNV